MPKSKDEFEAGRSWDTIEAQIQLFLRNNWDKAFNISEIAQGLGYQVGIKDFWSFIGGVASYWVIQNALDTLVKEGKVKAKRIKERVGEEIYYMAI